MQNTTLAANGFDPIICRIINKSVFVVFYSNTILKPKVPPIDRPAAPADKLASWSKFTVLSAPRCGATQDCRTDEKKEKVKSD